jgi:hypothetical protein
MDSLVEQLNDEADLCRNEGADDVAALLSQSAAELARLKGLIADELEAALCAPTWPDSLAHVHTATAALTAMGDV